ncbi:hypothetical protein [Moraxella pluranimalium]|uniref:Uncharacterized protein n=1 Tax=Moraxella pluranimalium TaxID=470453 RepID=A0A1T0CJW6_9GAMM|nr:hypothetical protein [Moraxella pluranimalium]OOS22646.1 hypothetical protein B0680_09325 [Moraxella pluranimalium]
MLKKLLLATAITLTGLTAISTPAVASNFSAKKMAKTTIDSLEFKDVMRGLYAGKMMQVYLDDEDLLRYPHIGLNDNLFVRNDSTYTTALMHPVVSYQNHNGEDRYLVIIEKVDVLESGTLFDCTGCIAYADFFIFKDLPDGRYQLVSQNKKDDISSGSHGRFHLSIDDIANNIQLLGNGLTGSIFRVSGSHQGIDFAAWDAILLSEDDYIRYITVADAGGDSEGYTGKNNPLHYSFDSTLKVINDASKYFPIQVHYYGEMPIDEEYQNIRRVDKTETFYYNKAKNAYSKTKPRK